MPFPYFYRYIRRMQQSFFEYILLILIILALVMIARKIKIAYPIVLVIGGVLLSFAARFTSVDIEPELVFFIFLPPLLYEAAWQTSWKEFWKWRRIITSFAFPIVILTACLIAIASRALIPGFTLALGFLLGGIISPPDAVSATTIMRSTKAPKAMVSIIEGESLLNDASSLIVFRFALAAVITGQFTFQQAALSFFLVIIMGIAIGLLIGLIFYAIHRWLPTTTSIEIVLTLVTPYCMYYGAEYFHYSGVLAVVSGGLFLSSKRQTLLNYKSRLEGVNVWTSLVFVLNGLVFILIGLQLPSIVNQLGDISIASAIWYGVAISVILIVIRMCCTIGATLWTRFISRYITVADPNPGWKAPIIFGWAGMRGVVSLAAALSIPLLTANGQAFPYRSLILFITFIVILITLVLQGLTLPWLIRKVKMEDKYTLIPEQRQETIIQMKLAKASLRHLADKFNGTFPNDHLNNLHQRLNLDLHFFERELKHANNGDSNMLDQFYFIYLEILEQQRKLLHDMNELSEFDEDIIRKYMGLTDIEELKVREKLAGRSTIS